MNDQNEIARLLAEIALLERELHRLRAENCDLLDRLDAAELSSVAES